MREELELAARLLEHACWALQKEMQEFAFKESMVTLLPFADDQDWGGPIKDLQDWDYGGWSEPEPGREFAARLQVVQKGIQDRVDVDPVVRGQVKEEERLVSTARWLAVEFFSKRLETARGSPSILESVHSASTSDESLLETARVSLPTLKALAQQADFLRNFTEMWTIYQVAWEQRHKESRDSEIKEGPILRSLRAADGVVRSLYEVVQQQKLDLEMPHQLLIVVPFMSSLYAAGFDLPTPYIVAPYWGHRQVWTWLAYAHEVGHHVYRNVKGLSDELEINLALELWSRGEGYDIQYIWFHWLEEIFADLFGLLQIGPAFARTQQLMLPHLPFRVLRRMGESPNLGDALLRAADETHPIPYLRVLLAIRALEKLGTTDIEPLKEKWDTRFQDVDTSKVYARVRGRYVELPADRMEEVGNTVLEVILKTDLYALAEKSSDEDEKEPTETESSSCCRKLEDFCEPLDEDKVQAALNAISGVPSGGFDTRHLLAATQKSLQDLWEKTEGKPSDEDIDDLNTRVINTIMGAYQESALPAI